MNENFYLALLHSLWISQKKLNLIFEKNQNFKDFYENLNNSNLKNYFLEKDIPKIIERKRNLNENFIQKVIEKNEVKLISKHDWDYPENLKHIPNSPFLIYVKWEIWNSPKLSVIWSRNMTSYGKKAIEKIIPRLTKYFTIVSWWAIWCDSEAHFQTLENWWKTIVVVGTWIDQIYPVSNKNLYEKVIASWWGIISIFPIWEPANNYNFPIRNEIISWLSIWVIVVESSLKSWSLITANLALEQWKDVFAIPWDIFKANSEWCNTIIKTWQAKMITSSEDILEEYNINQDFSNSEKSSNSINFENDIEKIIYDLLILESLDIDEIIEKTKLSLGEISTNISMMEIKWIIKKSLNWKYEVN